MKKQKLNTKKKTVLNKFRNKEQLCRLFLSLMLMFSVVLTFISLAGIDCHIWPVLGVGAFFTLLIWLEWGRKTSVYGVLIFVFGFILIGFVMKNHFALNSVLMLYNALAEKIGSLGLRNPALYAVDVAESAYPLYFSYLMSLFSAFAGVVAYMTVAHKQYIYPVVYSLILTVCVLLGFELYPVFLITYVAVIFLILIYNRVGRVKFSYLYIAGGVVITAFISLIIADFMSPVLNSGRSPYELISDSRYYNESKSDSYGNGRLSGHVYEKTSDVALKVTMSEPRPMYLRGFTAISFNGSSWEEPDCDISYTEGELFYLLHKNEFNNYSQSANFSFFINQDSTTSTVDIEYVNAGNKYVYLPYETKSFDTGNVLEINGDFYKRVPSGTNKYSITVTPMLYQKLLTLKPENEDKLIGVTYENFAVCELNYRKYVENTYLEVRDSDKDIIKAVLAEEEIQYDSNGTEDYSEIVEQVRMLINSRLNYDENIKISLFEDNCVDYLLNSSGRGYDKHYATIATLMFRTMGVPARYVEGYIIPINEAVKIKSNEQYNVKGTNAHAWSEIYVNGAGWVPVEIYGEDYDKMFPAVEQIGSETSDINKIDTGDDTDKENNISRKPKVLSEISVLWAIVIILTVFILILFAIVFIRRMIIIRKRDILFNQDDLNKVFLAYYDYLAMVLRMCAFVDSDEKEILESYGETLDGESADEVKEFSMLLIKAEASCVDEKDLLFTKEFVKKNVEAVTDKQSIMKNIYLYIIVCV